MSLTKGDVARRDVGRNAALLPGPLPRGFKVRPHCAVPLNRAGWVFAIVLVSAIKPQPPPEAVCDQNVLHPRRRQVGRVARAESTSHCRLISQVMQANGWAAGDALFVDDSKEHIDKASPICRTLLVDKSVNGGMSTKEFEAIRQSAGLPSAIQQQQQANGS